MAEGVIDPQFDTSLNMPIDPYMAFDSDDEMPSQHSSLMGAAKSVRPSTISSFSALRSRVSESTLPAALLTGVAKSKEVAANVHLDRGPFPAFFALVTATGLFALGIFTGGYSLRSALPVVQAARSPLELDGDSLSVPEQESVVERAAQGEKQAVNELEEKEAWSRSVEETAALSEARLAEARQAATALGEKLSALDPDSVSKTDIKELFAFAGDDRTYQEGLRGLAQLPGPLASDLLYRATRTYRRKDDVARLAAAFLATAEVNDRASPAMTVVLAAIDVESCEGARDVLELAVDNGDRRAVRHLNRFKRRTGCGKNGRKDCYECLRVDKLLEEGIRSARGRPVPF